jgi:inner membrane protein
LDSGTSYGTQLFWPFNDERVSWNVISIIDPLFTVPILAGIIVASIKQKPIFARAGLTWAVLYMSLGFVQRDLAVTMGKELAAARGHTILRIEAKPSMANLLLCKTVYETPQRYYVDAVRPGISPKIFVGSSIAKLDVAKDFSWLAPNSQQARDIERFRWFSKGYVAQDPVHLNRVIDVRYSMIPNRIAPLWSIELTQSAPPNTHVKFLTNREGVIEKAQTLWSMMFEKL